MLTRRLIPWWYIDDEGRAWPRAADLRSIVQTDDNGHPLLGGRPRRPALDDSPLPPCGSDLLRPRSATVESPETRHRRQVIIYSADAPLWTGAAKAIQLWRQLNGSHRSGELLLYRLVRLKPELALGRDGRVEAEALLAEVGDESDPLAPAFLDV